MHGNVFVSRWVVISFLTAIVSTSFANEAMDKEINYLLSVVKSSKCQIDRNGKLHTGPHAAKHMQRKYNHYKDKISSTQMFIEYSATRSMMSGRQYKIICQGGKQRNLADWLKEHLALFKKKNN